MIMVLIMIARMVMVMEMVMMVRMIMVRMIMGLMVVEGSHSAGKVIKSQPIHCILGKVITRPMSMLADVQIGKLTSKLMSDVQLGGWTDRQSYK